MTTPRTITLAVTLGDPGGIGPEIALKSVHGKAWPAWARFVFIGSRAVLAAQARRLHLPAPRAWAPGAPLPAQPSVWEPGGGRCAGCDGRPFRRIPLEWAPGRTGVSHGRAAADWIRAGATGCLAGWFDGLVTAPICKKSLALAGIPHPGHTEYLAALTHAPRFAMLLMGGPLRVALVTRHVPLASVPKALTAAAILETASLAAEALPWLGVRSRMLGICALNPHAGERCTLGCEEARIIAPALRALRRRGIEFEGPVPADVIFHNARRGRYGIVVAMYHDQGLGPLKTLAFESGVNLTLGLPILRVSPDHGTAFDLAGSGRAHPGSMIQAIRWALRLARRSNPWARA